MPWLSSRELNYYLSEIERLRDAYERERERADRAVDNLMFSQGNPPIGETTRTEIRGREEKLKGLTEQLAELMLDETPLLDGEEPSALPPPVEVKD